MIISVDEKPNGDGRICGHYLHKMGKGEAGGDDEREVNYTIESRLEEAVMAVDSSSNAAKFLEVLRMASTGRQSGTAVCRHCNGGDRIVRVPTVHHGALAQAAHGTPVARVGAVALEEISELEGDAKEQSG